jgi:NADH dehydrogenase
LQLRRLGSRQGSQPMSTRTTASSHHVVVIGAGFGGLETVHRLAGAPVRITLIDRRNHHLFQPLLYQVATASLAPSEIAWPIRHLLRKRRDVTTLLASVEAIDKDARRVRLDDGSTLDFDTLVLATGARHACFGITVTLYSIPNRGRPDRSIKGLSKVSP